MLWKWCTKYASKAGKLSSGKLLSFSLGTGKGQFSFQSQRKAMSKNFQTTAQLHSSHMLTKSCSKCSKLDFNSKWTMNFQMFKLDLEKEEEPEIKLLTSIASLKKKESSMKSIYFCLTDYAKIFDCVDQFPTNCGKFLKRWEYQTTSPSSWEICMQVKKQQLQLDMKQQTGSKSGKEYIKVVQCHPAYLTNIPSTLCKMPGWMKHNLESRLLGEMSITSDTQMTPPLWQKVRKNWRASRWKWMKRVKKLA